MKHHAAAVHYQKIVYWSDEDECFVGQCPGLMLGGVHGKDEARVYAALCDVVDDVLRTMDADAAPLPPPTAREFSGTFNLRVDPVLHRTLVARAGALGQSLNKYVERVLTDAVDGRSNAARRRTG